MMLVTHILFASISIFYSAILLFTPSKLKQEINYMLIFLTTVSGIALALTTPVNLGKFCIHGLIYLTYILIVSVVAYSKYAKKITG